MVSCTFDWLADIITEALSNDLQATNRRCSIPSSPACFLLVAASLVRELRPEFTIQIVRYSDTVYRIVFVTIFLRCKIFFDEFGGLSVANEG